jgi:antitoxin (DNA-binding transcriptional repressor) of toxin-antitoxin stability system
MMHHMKQASVRDLRYRFSEVERLLEQGEKIEITKHKRVIAHSRPVKTAPPKTWPDFLGRLRKIYGNKVLKVSGAELLTSERDRY